MKRTRSVTSKETDEKEDEKSGCPSKKTMKMRRYRSNVKNDPVRLEEMRRKDRERKRKKREEQKNEIIKGNKNLAKELKEKHRLYVANYRAKTKAKKNKTKEKVDNSSKDAPDKKKNAVLRTQNWRLRLQLKKAKPKKNSGTCNPNKCANQNQNIDTHDEVSKENQKNDSQADSSTEDASKCMPSPSRWAIYRGVKKVKEVLPGTPAKKVAIIEKLINSEHY